MRYLDIAEPEDFEERMIEILDEDDVEKFSTYIFEVDLSKDFYTALLDLCLEEQAKNCSLHLLQGKLPYGPPTVTYRAVGGRDNPALFSALRNLCDPEVIELLLKNCGGDRHVNQTIMGFLPLHFVLGDLVKLHHLSKWSLGQGQSMIKLIFLLFLPEVKPTLDCARLLAEYTNSVNEVALGFVQHGQLIQLAGLLLVARERAMAPFSSGETIKQHSSMESIVSQVICGQCITATTGAAALLDVFEMAGAAFTMYYRSIPEDVPVVEVIVQVAEIIQKAGIQVMYTDVDLMDFFSFRPMVLRSISERLGIEIDGTLKEFQMSKKPLFPSRKSLTNKLPAQYPSVHELLGDLGYKYKPFNNRGTRAFSTSSQIVDKISTRNWKHSWACPSERDMAYLAMKLKRGVRLL